MLQQVRTGMAASALALIAITASSASADTTDAKGSSGPHYTSADVQFMQGMIAHHAQAIVMASMAPTHGASAQVNLFCRKIALSQRDEIELMQSWLRENGERVPDPSAAHAADALVADAHAGMDMEMSGGHAMVMPGMLTHEQLAQLDQARGAAFDRLFLTFMIQHHEGALAMVAKLFASPGAGQTPEIFGYATGVDADQRAEIARMQGMLTAMPRQ